MLLTSLFCLGCCGEAVSAKIVASAGARIWLSIVVYIKILISTLIYRIYLIALTVALERTCARPPTPQVALIHRIRTAGGTGSSATMVMLFARLFVLFVQSYSLWLNSQGLLTVLLFVPHWCAPNLKKARIFSQRGFLPNCSMMACLIKNRGIHKNINFYFNI